MWVSITESKDTRVVKWPVPNVPILSDLSEPDTTLIAITVKEVKCTLND